MAIFSMCALGFNLTGKLQDFFIEYKRDSLILWFFHDCLCQKIKIVQAQIVYVVFNVFKSRGLLNHIQFSSE